MTYLLFKVGVHVAAGVAYAFLVRKLVIGAAILTGLITTQPPLGPGFAVCSFSGILLVAPLLWDCPHGRRGRQA